MARSNDNIGILEIDSLVTCQFMQGLEGLMVGKSPTLAGVEVTGGI